MGQSPEGDQVPMVQFEMRSLDKNVRVKPISVPEEDAGQLTTGTTLAFAVWIANPEEIKAFHER